MTSIYFGIDLGGTKVEAVAMHADGKVLARRRVPTEQQKGYTHILEQIAQALHLVEGEVGQQARTLGVGTPGAIDPPTGLMKNSNTTVLNGKPLHRDLENQLQIPVHMANDANCFAVAETLLGAGKDYQQGIVFGVIMGTGVGGGIVIKGQVWGGRHGIGGEWGHSFLDTSGGPCYCGQVGCVETLISGTGLERYYHTQTGQQRKLASILAAYEAGNPEPPVQATVERLLHFFGKGLANVIDILDPTAIVLGGGLSKIDLLYSTGVERVRQHVFNPRLDTPILRPLLGDSAGVFGAAMLTVS
jgi:fructokinase